MKVSSSLAALLPALALIAVPAAALDAAAMRSRSVYQLVTDRFALPDGASSSASSCPAGSREYCGGTWNAVASKLDYIKGMGFDTVWISPVVSNIEGSTGWGEAYHGYWTENPEKLNTHFGTEDDLRALSKALHDKGMYLMVDVVVNHVATTSGSSFKPSSSYGPFASPDVYNSFCWIKDYKNQTAVEDCWLGDDKVALPDLKTESPEVANYWNAWVKSLVANYTIDAIRIDTVKHVDMAFWPNFVSAAGVFTQGEVLDGDVEYIANYQNKGKTNPFNYAVYYPLTRAFNSTKGDFAPLVKSVQAVRDKSNDASIYGSFLNNHDNPRFESITSDQALIKNAHVYPFVTDGIPYLYYGSEAGFKGGNDPDNREALWPSNYDTSSPMYKFFTSLNNVRAAAGESSEAFYSVSMSVTALSANDLLIHKGPLVALLNNRGASGSADVTIPGAETGWRSNTRIVEALSCRMLPTGDKGDLTVNIRNGEPMVFIEESRRGDRVCPGSDLVAAEGGKSGASARMSTIGGLASILVAAAVGAVVLAV